MQPLAVSLSRRPAAVCWPRALKQNACQSSHSMSKSTNCEFISYCITDFIAAQKAVVGRERKNVCVCVCDGGGGGAGINYSQITPVKYLPKTFCDYYGKIVICGARNICIRF